jgi:hypothetical protein
MCFRQLRKSDALTVFNDGIARAVHVDVHIMAFMHPELPTVDHQYAVADTGDVCWSCYLAAEEKTR